MKKLLYTLTMLLAINSLTFCSHIEQDRKTLDETIKSLEKDLETAQKDRCRIIASYHQTAPKFSISDTQAQADFEAGLNKALEQHNIYFSEAKKNLHELKKTQETHFPKAPASNTSSTSSTCSIM